MIFLFYSCDWNSHLIHLRQVLQVLAHHELFAKFSKCSFGLRHVEYPGHVISQRGVEADPAKLQAVRDWPIPKNIIALRAFLGLSGYYRRFGRNYVAVSGSLTDLLKKNQFKWSPVAQKTFQELKDAMTSLPVLALPDFSQASHPITFFRKKLCPQMQVASAYEREMFAITSAIKKWRHYLLGRHFRIFTDQKSLRGLLAQTIQTPAQERWLSKLLGFDYEILYTPGCSNVVSDAFSRLSDPLEALFASAFTYQPNILDQLRSFYVDTLAGQNLIRKFHDTSADQNKNFHIHQGLLYFKNWIFILAESGLRPVLLEEHHSTPVGGHSGIKGTL